MSSNNEDKEIEIVIEIKIKCTPTLEMLGVIERFAPSRDKSTDDNHSNVKSLDGGPARTIPVPSHMEPLSTGPARTTSTTPSVKPQGEPVSKTRTGMSGIPWPSHPPQQTEAQLPLKQIGKIDENDFITEEPQTILGFNNIEYRETKGKRLFLTYGTSKIYTTWADIHVISQLTDKNQIKAAIERLIAPGRVKNKYTAVSRFVKAVKLNKVSPWQPATPEGEDPDAGYRPVLQGVIDTKVDKGLDD